MAAPGCCYRGTRMLLPKRQGVGSWNKKDDGFGEGRAGGGVSENGFSSRYKALSTRSFRVHAHLLISQHAKKRAPATLEGLPPSPRLPPFWPKTRRRKKLEGVAPHLNHVGGGIDEKAGDDRVEGTFKGSTSHTVCRRKFSRLEA